MKRQVVIQVVDAGADSFVPPFIEDFALLLVIANAGITSEKRERMALDIVRARCQYALTFGPDCEAWHDAIDEACLNELAPAERFLMTTWHDDETLEEVLGFLWRHTSYDDFVSERLAIVQIGEDAGLESTIRAKIDGFLQSQTM